MKTARESIVVKVPLETIQKSWFQFTGEAGSYPSGLTSAPHQSSESHEAEKGKVYFASQGDTTLVTMELRYNAVALRQAGLSEDWIRRRIGLFLQRFKAQAER